MLATLARFLAPALLPLPLLAGTTLPAFGQAQPAPRPQARTPLAVPDNKKLAVMIHSALMALNNANLTGNYTVLRDLGAPGFQAANPPARLADIFGHLRSQKLDLSPIVLFTPKLVRYPAINDRGLLSLNGFFDTRPQRVQFDLLYQPVDGEWRLFGIGVKTAPATATTADASRGAPPPAPLKRN